MSVDPRELTQWNREYARLREELSQIGYLSQGSVAERMPPGGPRYQWTRKEKAKTVSVALSEDQFIWMKEAIANQRCLTKIVRQMQKISRQILFATVAGTAHRKRLSKKVLGLN